MADARSYSTTFSATETPLSEGGAWTTGNDPLQTQVNSIAGSGGIAFGTQTGNEAAGGNFNDSEAYLTTVYNNNQRCSAVIHKTGVGIVAPAFQEVELLLRWSVGALRTGLPFGDTHSYGYEINMAWDGAYIQIGRFKELPALFDSNVSGSPITTLGVNDGDIFMVEMIGNTITAWLNRNGNVTQIAQGTDTTGVPFTNGSPGVGFFLDNNHTGSTNAQSACFTSFQASEVSAFPEAHTSKGFKGGGITLATTDPIDTTGCTGFIVGVSWTDNITFLTSVNDNEGNGNYTRLGPATDSGLGYFGALYFVENATPGAAQTFSAHFSSAVGNATIFAIGVSGVVPHGLVDRAPNGFFSTNSPPAYVSNTTAPTSQDDELLLAITFTGSAAGTETVVWGDSFIALDAIGDTSFITGASAYKAVTQTGTYESSLTSSGAGTTNAIAFIVSLRALTGVNVPIVDTKYVTP